MVDMVVVAKHTIINKTPTNNYQTNKTPTNKQQTNKTPTNNHQTNKQLLKCQD